MDEITISKEDAERIMGLLINHRGCNYFKDLDEVDGLLEKLKPAPSHPEIPSKSEFFVLTGGYWQFQPGGASSLPLTGKTVTDDAKWRKIIALVAIREWKEVGDLPYKTYEHREAWAKWGGLSEP